MSWLGLLQTVKKNDSPIIDQHGRTIHMVNIATLNVRLRNAKDELANLVSDRARVEEAISNGDEEMKAMVWELIQAKKTQCRPAWKCPRRIQSGKDRSKNHRNSSPN